VPIDKPDFLSDQSWYLVAERLMLSRRQREIVAGVLQGHPETVIAELMGISPHTVHTYLLRVYRKLGVTDRAQLVAYAFRAYAQVDNGDLV